MIRTRMFRTVVASALTLGLLSSPITTLGATANLAIGGGTTVGTADRAPTPQTVSPGKVAGFYLWALNNDTANLPTFRLTVTTNATPYGAYWYHDGMSDYTACQISPQLMCDFGTFGSGTGVKIVAAFTLPSSTSTSTSNCLPEPSKRGLLDYGFGPDPSVTGSWVCFDFRYYSDQGNVPGKNKSRGDEFHWFDYVATDGNPKDDAAQFPYCDLSDQNAACNSSLLTLSNSTNLSRSPNNQNFQYTTVQAPQAAFNSAYGTSGIAVRDGGTFNVTCTTTICDSEVAGNGGFLGETSQVSVNRLPTSEPKFDDWILTTIGMLGVNFNQIDGVVHWYLDENGAPREDILGRCSSSAGPDSSTPDKGCFWAANGPGNTAIVYVWTHYNGSVRMF